jgi:phenylalanine-4-hydroxylase
MTRDEVLDQLKRERAEFDKLVDAIPADAMDEPVPDGVHSPKQIVAHVSAYEQLIVERLRAARLGQTTDLDRDRVGWESFNDRIWSESESVDAEIVLTQSARMFLAMLEELASLPDSEFGALSKVAEAIDPGWLRGQALWEVIGVDTFEHYPMHYAQLEAAARTDALRA